jgi:hypothetical protein
MHHQADGWPYAGAGVEDVYRRRALDIEAVERRRGAHAGHGFLTEEQVESGEALAQVGWFSRIHAVPDAQDPAVANLHVELLAGHDGQQFPGGGQTAGPTQQLVSGGSVHRVNIGHRGRPR